MTWLSVLVVVLVAIGVVGYGLHRVLLWADARGWVFYKTKGRTGAASSALLELDAIWKPEIQHVIEQREVEADHEVDDESGNGSHDEHVEQRDPSQGESPSP